MEKKITATEAGHFYYPDGRPAYEINGKPTTIKEARELGLFPSVTEVLKILPKKGLFEWQKRQILYSSLTLPKQEGWTDADYVRAILEDAEEHARMAREKGTYYHGIIERYLQGLPLEPEEKTFATRVMDTIREEIGIDDFESEKSYARELDPGIGYGGKIDLLNIPEGIIIDIKTKEFTPGDKKLHYDDHVRQLTAYSYLVWEDDWPCKCKEMWNIFVSTHKDHLGEIRIVKHNPTGKEAYRAFTIFKCALRLWYALYIWNR